MAGTVLTPDRYADIEVHDWEFGGRRTRTGPASVPPFPGIDEFAFLKGRTYGTVLGDM
ncbi:putative protein OS=Streptomyces aurantiogriseus OX=66870 GN=GCM10010251_68630 PE=4 SV=1 [Streptomyces aurantiogriseus]|uniref:Uncharacterized protein n=1 Tax=Streptomyces aurantiogriseus TaxID=66870 RepID=A0A918KXQ6_9ACTN|nr:hypothetical protein GCM10010251_68630 [Streptomyces aurantiogriseus]